MTRQELRLLYKRQTGKNPYLDNRLRQLSIIDNYRVYQDYVQWLEEELIRLKELKRKLLPWEK